MGRDVDPRLALLRAGHFFLSASIALWPHWQHRAWLITAGLERPTARAVLNLTNEPEFALIMSSRLDLSAPRSGLAHREQSDSPSAMRGKELKPRDHSGVIEPARGSRALVGLYVVTIDP